MEHARLETANSLRSWRHPNFIDQETRSQAGHSTHKLMMNQIGSCDKVAYQQYVDEAIARDSRPDVEIRY